MATTHSVIGRLWKEELAGVVLMPQDYPRKAQFFILGLILCGLPVIAHSIHSATAFNDLTWLALGLATVLASLLQIRLPNNGQVVQSLTLTVSDVFMFAAILLFSPEIAVTISLIDGLLSCFKRTNKLYRMLFNLSQVSLVTFIVGHLFYWIQGQQAPLDRSALEHVPLFFISLILCAFLYFFLNTGAVTTAISLATSCSPSELWKENFLHDALIHVSVAVSVATIFLSFERNQLLAIVGMTVPLVVVVFYAHAMNRNRVTTLQASQLFLQSTLNSLSSNIAILDRKGQIVAVNHRWNVTPVEDHLFGPRHGVGTNYLDTCLEAFGTGDASGKALAAGVGRVASGEEDFYQLEYALDSQNGTRWFNVRVTRFEGEGPVRVVVEHDEITERKNAEEALRQSEEQLLQSQKMEAVGRLAGGVAHDFNNMLTAILGYGDLVAMDPGNVSLVEEGVGEIVNAANRAAGLTRQLLAFSRKQVLQPRKIELNQLVSDLEKMLVRIVGDQVKLEKNLGTSTSPIKADPGQIEQVLMNLVINGRDAMPEGGVITVSTRNQEVSAEQVEANPQFKQGEFVVMSVRDTGTGMDEETMAKIFEPFFTTKQMGKGTGLGLSTVYGIVRQSGGFIHLTSTLGEGTTFEIYLPRAVEESELAPIIGQEVTLQAS